MEENIKRENGVNKSRLVGIQKWLFFGGSGEWESVFLGIRVEPTNPSCGEVDIYRRVGDGRINAEFESGLA